MKITKEDAIIVGEINRAIEGRFLLSISYVDATNKPSVRTIEPYEIKDGKLFAHCLTKDATRAFKLVSIQSTELLADKYTPRY